MDLFRRLLKNRVAKNAGWLVGSKVVQMILSFFISLLTARYLGPSNYGLINYATAYTTFFSALCSLGLNSIIVKELLDNPDSEGNVLGTVIGMKLLSSICSVLCIVGISIICFCGKDRDNFLSPQVFCRKINNVYKMSNKNKNMLPLKRISFLGNNG